MQYIESGAQIADSAAQVAAQITDSAAQSTDSAAQVTDSAAPATTSRLNVLCLSQRGHPEGAPPIEARTGSRSTIRAPPEHSGQQSSFIRRRPRCSAVCATSYWSHTSVVIFILYLTADIYADRSVNHMMLSELLASLIPTLRYSYVEVGE